MPDFICFIISLETVSATAFLAVPRDFFRATRALYLKIGDYQFWSLKNAEIDIRYDVRSMTYKFSN